MKKKSLKRLSILTSAALATLLIAPGVSTIISDIRSNPHQPRQYFDEEALKELSLSINRVGIILTFLFFEFPNCFSSSGMPSL